MGKVGLVNVPLQLSLLLRDPYPLPALWTWDAPGAACRLARHQAQEALGRGLHICWFPCQGSCRISGGPPPHPDLARQVCLPRDPHCSLLASGQVQPQARHRPAQSFPVPPGRPLAAQDCGEQAASSGGPPTRRRLLTDSEPGLQSRVEEALGLAHPGYFTPAAWKL